MFYKFSVSRSSHLTVKNWVKMEKLDACHEKFYAGETELKLLKINSRREECFGFDDRFRYYFFTCLYILSEQLTKTLLIKQLAILLEGNIRHYQFEQQKTTGVISGSRLFFYKPDEFLCASSYIIKVSIIINWQQHTYVNTNNPNEISVTTQTRCKSSCHSPSWQNVP